MNRTIDQFAAKNHPPGLAGVMINSLEDYAPPTDRRADWRKNSLAILREVSSSMDNASFMVGSIVQGKGFINKTMKAISARVGLGYDATLRHFRELEAAGILTIKMIAERRKDSSIRHTRTIIRFTLIGIKIITGLRLNAIRAMRDKARRFIRTRAKARAKKAQTLENDKQFAVMAAARRKAEAVTSVPAGVIKPIPPENRKTSSVDPTHFLDWVINNPGKPSSDYRKFLDRQTE